MLKHLKSVRLISSANGYECRERRLFKAVATSNPAWVTPASPVSYLQAHSLKVIWECKQLQLRDQHGACGLRQEHTWRQPWAGRDRHWSFSTCLSLRRHFQRQQCRAWVSPTLPSLQGKLSVLATRPAPAETPNDIAWGVWEAAPGQTLQLPIVPPQSLAAVQNINEPQIVVCLWLISRTLKWLLCQFCPVSESLSFVKRIR